MGKASRSKEERIVAPEGDLRKELEKLTPEQLEMFMRALELATKKRRILMMGYLTALMVMISGLVWAAYAFATKESGQSSSLLFLLPFTVAALVFIVFGRVSRAIKK